MKAIFDTGSTNTWIIGKNTDLGHKFDKFYDPTKSSTLKKPASEKEATIPFGIGILGGNFVKDTLTLGDSKGKNITIANMEFGIVSRSKGIFENP
jgi:hypothetical protein